MVAKATTNPPGDMVMTIIRIQEWGCMNIITMEEGCATTATIMGTMVADLAGVGTTVVRVGGDMAAEAIISYRQ